MICALIGLLPSPALAAEDRDATVSAEDAALYQSHLDQARFFASRDHINGEPKQLPARAQKLVAVARFAQGLGRNCAHLIV